jgi:hypothetical protein
VALQRAIYLFAHGAILGMLWRAPQLISRRLRS